ncbi:MAG: carbohydrate-binding domain-containing protein [Coriobacteriia bacterium]|nr:carbohydrate-binding domain-containing protein [Coriobacteriia bacterium]MCL2537222.1 carbohydrate-binding domain-containing protein [Coriobacteriia bacterium]
MNFTIRHALRLLALSLLLCVFAAGLAPLQAQAAITISYLDLVGKSNDSSKLSSERWEWSATTSTLKLHEGFDLVDTSNWGIRVPPGSTIEVLGNASVRSTTSVGIGVLGSGKLTIMGPGTLTVSSGAPSLLSTDDLTVNGGVTVKVRADEGSYAETALEASAGKIIIDNATVEIAGAQTGMKSSSDILIRNDATVSVWVSILPKPVGMSAVGSVEVDNAQLKVTSFGRGIQAGAQVKIAGSSYLSLRAAADDYGISSSSFLMTDGVLDMSESDFGISCFGTIEFSGGIASVKARRVSVSGFSVVFSGGRTSLQATASNGFVVLANNIKSAGSLVYALVGQTPTQIASVVPFELGFTFRDPAQPTQPLRNAVIDRAVTVQAQSFGNGTARTSHSSTIAGMPVTLSVTPNAGYRHVSWHTAKGGVTVSNNRFIMPPADVIVIAKFDPKTQPAAAHLQRNVTSMPFNNSQRAVSVSARPGVVGMGNATVHYQGTKGTRYARTTTRPRHIGTYIVSVNLTEGTHFHARNNLPLGEFKIVPAGNRVTRLTAGRRSVRVTWSRVSNAHAITRYQVRVRELGAKNWRPVRTLPARANNTNITGLKRGKRYQVQTRSFKTVGGLRHYSAWSPIRLSARVR